MHTDYQLINNENKVKRIFYNSTLVYSESEFPFHIDEPANTENFKNLRLNLEFYKQKLQNQYKKCRDFIKEEIEEYSKESNSGVLKEIILEQMCRESKRKLLNQIRNMGLKIKEDVNAKETVILVDLSPISSNKEAIDRFLSFIEKKKERLNERREKKCKTQKIKEVSTQNDLNLNFRNKKMNAKKSMKSVRFKDSKIKTVSQNISAHKYNSASINQNQVNTISFENEHKVSNQRSLPSPMQPHYYKPNPALFLPSLYSLSSKHKKHCEKKEDRIIEHQLSSLYKDLRKSKSNNHKYNDIKSKYSVHSNHDESLKSDNQIFENLFKSHPPSENVENKKITTKMKKNKFNKIFSTLKYLFAKNSKYEKDKVMIDPYDREARTVISYNVETESNSPPNDSQIRKSISFSNRLKIIEEVESPVEGTSTEEHYETGGRKETLLLNHPPEIWGRKVWIDSKKEQEILLAAKEKSTKSKRPEIFEDFSEEQPVEVTTSDGNNIERRRRVLLLDHPTEVSLRISETEQDILPTSKERLSGINDRFSQQSYHEQLNQPNVEVKKILNQQMIIKEMIENIQDTLKRQQSLPSSPPSKVMKAVENLQSPYSDDTYNTESAISCHCDSSICTSNLWSDKATNGISYGDKSRWLRSINESTTNLPNGSCWCLELCAKLKSLCISWCKKSETECKIKAELLNQRREILRINTLLDRHMQHNHPT